MVFADVKGPEEERQVIRLTKDGCQWEGSWVTMQCSCWPHWRAVGARGLLVATVALWRDYRMSGREASLVSAKAAQKKRRENVQANSELSSLWPYRSKFVDSDTYRRTFRNVRWFLKMCACVRACVRVCVCESERDRESGCVDVCEYRCNKVSQISTTSIHSVLCLDIKDLRTWIWSNDGVKNKQINKDTKQKAV